MVSKTLKALVALGLVAAAGQSFALYSIGGNYVYSKYCAGFMTAGPLGGRTYTANTLAECQAQLATGKSQIPGPYTEFTDCHICAQKFSYMIANPDTGTTLSATTVQQFQNATAELRQRFRIDEYERAQQDLERSLSSPDACGN